MCDDEIIVDLQGIPPDYLTSTASVMGSLIPEAATITIAGCDKIVLRAKDLDFSIDLTPDYIEQFEKIIINGITFIRENNENGNTN